MDSVTGTSVIPLNASSEDLDDVVDVVTFYVDGVEFDSKKEIKMFRRIYRTIPHRLI